MNPRLCPQCGQDVEYDETLTVPWAPHSCVFYMPPRTGLQLHPPGGIADQELVALRERAERAEAERDEIKRVAMFHQRRAIKAEADVARLQHAISIHLVAVPDSPSLQGLRDVLAATAGGTERT